MLKILDISLCFRNFVLHARRPCTTFTILMQIAVTVLTFVVLLASGVTTLELIKSGDYLIEVVNLFVLDPERCVLKDCNNWPKLVTK